MLTTVDGGVDYAHWCQTFSVTLCRRERQQCTESSIHHSGSNRFEMLGSQKILLLTKNSLKRLFLAEFLFQQIITVIWPYLGRGIKEGKIILKHLQSCRRVARLKEYLIKNTFGDCLYYSSHTP